MYTIYCIELADPVVETAYAALQNDTQVVLPPTNGNYVLVTGNSSQVFGDGNPTKNIAVILGHGSPNGVSGQKTYLLYAARLHSSPANPSSIYVVSCDTAAEGSLFAYGNFANSVKTAFPEATVWASETGVDADTFEGDWVQV
ncbi:hypothetical protein IQ13_4197 [Lacibacter cauensis]|uniref:DUF4347 domain-containing protein n=1 Tax=Lacibacter cauensis TaxID=510947 RepID=A0A562S983_9BACT|nr:hypothetical protein [Lacibacter cauensis]TWI77955.1 hypothetical protein IQ13_4197 [Lacibacter cauensis]